MTMSALIITTSSVIDSMTNRTLFTQQELDRAQSLIPEFECLNRSLINIAEDKIFVNNSEYIGYMNIDYPKGQISKEKINISKFINFNISLDKMFRFQRFVFQMKRSGIDIKRAEMMANEIIDQDENIRLKNLQLIVQSELERHHSPEMHKLVYGGVNELPYSQSRFFYDFVIEKVYRANKKINYWTGHGSNAWIFS